MLRARAASLLVLLLGASASAGSELVIVTESTREYHRPSCAVVRDGKAKDLVAMNRAQAGSRGYKAHDACDPANPAAGSPADVDGPSRGPQPPLEVFTAEGDNRYHRATCPKLANERKKVLLEEAGRKHWPCSACRPPIRKRTPAIPKR